VLLILPFYFGDSQACSVLPFYFGDSKACSVLPILTFWFGDCKACSCACDCKACSVLPILVLPLGVDQLRVHIGWNHYFHDLCVGGGVSAKDALDGTTIFFVNLIKTGRLSHFSPQPLLFFFFLFQNSGADSGRQWMHTHAHLPKPRTPVAMGDRVPPPTNHPPFIIIGVNSNLLKLHLKHPVPKGPQGVLPHSSWGFLFQYDILKILC